MNNTSTSRIKDAVLTSFCHKLFLKKGRTYNPDGAEFRKVYRECGYKNLKRQDLEKWVHSICRIYFDCINAPCDEVYLNNFVDHVRYTKPNATNIPQEDARYSCPSTTGHTHEEHITVHCKIHTSIKDNLEL